MSNFLGLAIAQESAGRLHEGSVAQQGTAAVESLTVFTASAASVGKALSMLGIGRERLPTVATLPGGETADVERLQAEVDALDGAATVEWRTRHGEHGRLRRLADRSTPTTTGSGCTSMRRSARSRLFPRPRRAWWTVSGRPTRSGRGPACRASLIEPERAILIRCRAWLIRRRADVDLETASGKQGGPPRRPGRDP